MGLLFKNSVEKADKIIAKYEAKRTELQGKIVQLNDDARFLQSAVEDDFSACNHGRWHTKREVENGLE